VKSTISINMDKRRRKY
ncbi:hypothetical protein ACTFIW_009065, partial [Dictyostelium discoideum]